MLGLADLAHMMNHIGEQVATEVVSTELVEVQHAVDKHETSTLSYG